MPTADLTNRLRNLTPAPSDLDLLHQTDTIVDTYQQLDFPEFPDWAAAYNKVAAATGEPIVTAHALYQRVWKALRDEGVTPADYAARYVAEAVSGPPDFDRLFRFIKDEPHSLTEIADHLDRGPSYIEGLIDQMLDAGYNISRETGRLLASTSRPARGNDPVKTVADEAGMDFTFGVISDIHSGSKHQQISAMNSFIDVGRHEYGVRHWLVPGDLTAGRRVYRGQEKEVYALEPDDQQDALNKTFPIHADSEYYVIGGNHDWSHVKNNGVDVVYRFCRQHDNVHYLGYHQADVPLTDRVRARMWHPSGGVPYAKSYRTQKGFDALLPDAFEQAILSGESPYTWFLLVGHLHVADYLPGLIVNGAICGCWEGQTGYLKEKGLRPEIGGWIFRVRVTDAGLIHRVEPIWVGHREIHQDYLNYPDLLDYGERPVAERVTPIFTGISAPEAEDGGDGSN